MMPNQTTLESKTFSIASAWRRVGAHFVDWVLLEALSWIFQLSAMWLGYKLAAMFQPGVAMPGFEDAFNSFWVQVANAAIYGIAALIWFVEWPVRFGTTPGKKLFDVYVVTTEEGKVPDRRRLLGRTFAYLLSYLPFGLGLWMVFFHPERAALHELVSRTRSVKGRPRT